jgi:hypothetical protein
MSHEEWGINEMIKKLNPFERVIDVQFRYFYCREGDVFPLIVIAADIRGGEKSWSEPWLGLSSSESATSPVILEGTPPPLTGTGTGSGRGPLLPSSLSNRLDCLECSLIHFISLRFVSGVEIGNIFVPFVPIPPVSGMDSWVGLDPGLMLDTYCTYRFHSHS